MPFLDSTRFPLEVLQSLRLVAEDTDAGQRCTEAIQSCTIFIRYSVLEYTISMEDEVV